MGAEIGAILQIWQEANGADQLWTISEVKDRAKRAPAAEAKTEEPAAPAVETKTEEPAAPAVEAKVEEPAAPAVEAKIEEPVAPAVEVKPAAAPAAKKPAAKNRRKCANRKKR